MELATRLNGIGEYYFSQKLREIDALNKAGKQIINLGIGSPDLPPHPDVIKVLHEESAKTNTHAYQNYKGSPLLRNAIAAWYAQWYGVQLDPETEVLPLIGSKEGIMHICMTYLEEGKLALIPNPGYPTYTSAVKLSGGTPLYFDLLEQNDWQPDFQQLEQLVLKHLGSVKLLFVNYPHMPTGQVASADVQQQLISFARKHGILIVHDNPYSFILNDSPQSLLGWDGAKEVVVELNSLSKSHNMAGWRVGMLTGAADRINEVLRFKSNMDSGMFLPLQLAAAKALSLDKSWFDAVNAHYSMRRNWAQIILETLGCKVFDHQKGMFLWAKVPAGVVDGFALSDQVLYNNNVFITPGGIFGSGGNEYVRISLCASEEKLQEALGRIKAD